MVRDNGRAAAPPGWMHIAFRLRRSLARQKPAQFLDDCARITKTAVTFRWRSSRDPLPVTQLDIAQPSISPERQQRFERKKIPRPDGQLIGLRSKQCLARQSNRQIEQ